MADSAFAQTSLAAAMLASTIGSYLVFTDPNRYEGPTPSSGDTVRALHYFDQVGTHVTSLPILILALHSAALAYLGPNVNSPILAYGIENGINVNLFTWSTDTMIPLFMILCIGVPLRLACYTSLGKNFTFRLAQPDRLKTSGIYRYVQHPSYTGFILVACSNFALITRIDGAISCWIPPALFGIARSIWWATAVFSFGVFTFAAWARVKEEESMLRQKFGPQWEKWHASTARFLPWIF